MADAAALRVVPPHANPHVLVMGLVFAAADAFGIGSNDVANSFATSVGSGSLTLRAACCIAVFTEFTGAMALGDRVSKTIKGNIIQLDQFDGQPDTLMLAMLCALVGSSLWVNNASRLGLPVSTSHSIVGATIGVGIAFGGPGCVQWGDARHGVGAIVLSWLISPLVAGLAASALFLATRFFVLQAPDSHARLLKLYPLYVTVTFSVVIFFMVLAGAPAMHLTVKDPVTGAKHIRSPAAVVGITLALASLVYAAAWRAKQTAWFNRYVAAIPLHVAAEADAELAEVSHANRKQAERAPLVGGSGGEAAAVAAQQQVAPAGGALARARALALSGVDQDVLTPSSDAAVAAHALAVRYDDATERLFSACQVFTAAFASLAHGANDVANAVSPLSVIARVWNQGGAAVPSSAPTPAWCLAYGALFLDIGLVLMGYRVMRSLGNNITYHSPSRGFCMELGALATVLWASATGNPVSTTHCITGATVGVGLCTGSLRAVNWRMVGAAMFGWLLTLPASALVSGVTFALIARSPKVLTPAEAHPGLLWAMPPPPGH